MKKTFQLKHLWKSSRERIQTACVSKTSVLCSDSCLFLLRHVCWIFCSSYNLENLHHSRCSPWAKLHTGNSVVLRWVHAHVIYDLTRRDMLFCLISSDAVKINWLTHESSDISSQVNIKSTSGHCRYNRSHFHTASNTIQHLDTDENIYFFNSPKVWP